MAGNVAALFIDKGNKYKYIKALLMKRGQIDKFI